MLYDKNICMKQAKIAPCLEAYLWGGVSDAMQDQSQLVTEARACQCTPLTFSAMSFSRSTPACVKIILLQIFC
jgi:hypothetical protein